MNTTERKPVDVLAVMDTAHFNLDFAAQAERLPHPENLRMAAIARDSIAEARAAVAELIEATIEFRACIAALVICLEQEAPDDIYSAVSERYLKADTRVDNALARVGGAA